jgi:hypothetical protein
MDGPNMGAAAFTALDATIAALPAKKLRRRKINGDFMVFSLFVI